MAFIQHETTNAVEVPNLRTLLGTFESVHKEADDLLKLASDLVGSEGDIKTGPGAPLQIVSGQGLACQLQHQLASLYTKLSAAREKFQRGHG